MLSLEKGVFEGAGFADRKLAGSGIDLWPPIVFMIEATNGPNALPALLLVTDPIGENLNGIIAF